MGFRGFGWLRPGRGWRRAEPDPAEMGTAFGLDASFAATPAVSSRPGGECASPVAGQAQRQGVPSRRLSWWQRLGTRLVPSR